MAKGLRQIDVSRKPELLRLAKEVRRTKQPCILRRGHEDIAIVVPVGTGTVADRREQVTEAQIWADAGVTGPADLWADYDADIVRTALQQARGALAGVDREELLEDLRGARAQDTKTRPA
jgi:hypothetical protein